MPAYCGPFCAIVSVSVARATEGAAPKMPAKLLGLNRSPMAEKSETTTPPMRKRSSNWANAPLRFGGLPVGPVFLGLVIIVIVGVLAVQLAATRAVHHDAEHVVLTQRLHGARDRINGCRADAHHQNSPVAQRRQQVGVGGEQQRRAVQNH